MSYRIEPTAQALADIERILVLWAGMHSFDQAPGLHAGGLVKFDCRTGRIPGDLDVAQARALHSVEQMPSGEPVTTMGNELLWFKAK
jgi:hypothetical protein